MGRHLRTHWDLLKPDVGRRVRQRQWKQKTQHDQHARLRMFQEGQSVMARNFRAGDPWIPGVIVRQLGPLTFLVDVSDGRFWKRHIDHLKNRLPHPIENETHPVPSAGFHHEEPSIEAPDATETPELSPSELVSSSANLSFLEAVSSPLSVPVQETASSLDSPPSVSRKQYPTRVRTRPDWYHAQNW